MATNGWAIDPQAQALLEMAAAAGRPPIDRLSPPEARLQFLETRGPTQPEPPALARVADLAATGPHGPIPMRLYRPLGAPDNALLPALIYYHGGGWVIGDLETHDVVCRQLAAQSGCIVVSVDYRLAPEHKFPAAVDDAFAAAKWLASEGGAHGVDVHRLAVGGDSAGGNLAAVVALLARDHLKAHGNGAPSLRFQLLVYPVTDSLLDTASYKSFAEGYLLTRDAMAWFFGHYLAKPAEGTDWRVAPLRAPNLAGLPPALIITAGCDPLRDEGEAYAKRLASEGVLVDYLSYGGMIHGFFTMGGVIDAANRAVAHAAHTLRNALHQGAA